jgi:hypothetical protein
MTRPADDFRAPPDRACMDRAGVPGPHRHQYLDIELVNPGRVYQRIQQERLVQIGTKPQARA